MRTHGIWMAVAFAATLHGLGRVNCDGPPGQVVSLNGIATDSTRIVDSALVGTWLMSDDSACDASLGREAADRCTCDRLIVRLEPERSQYILDHLSGCDLSDSLVMRAALTRIGRFEYLDEWMEPEEWEEYLLPKHFITRVDRRGDSLVFVLPLFDDWTECLSDAPGIRRLGSPMEWVATGTTEEMRQWIERRFKPHHFATAHSTTVPYSELVYVRAR